MGLYNPPNQTPGIVIKPTDDKLGIMTIEVCQGNTTSTIKLPLFFPFWNKERKGGISGYVTDFGCQRYNLLSGIEDYHKRLLKSEFSVVL